MELCCYLCQRLGKRTHQDEEVPLRCHWEEEEAATGSSGLSLVQHPLLQSHLHSWSVSAARKERCSWLFLSTNGWCLTAADETHGKRERMHLKGMKCIRYRDEDRQTKPRSINFTHILSNPPPHTQTKYWWSEHQMCVIQNHLSKNVNAWKADYHVEIISKYQL